MLTAVHAALESLAADSAVRAVVLGGAGKAFCAGHDLKQMKANPSLEYYQRLFDDCSRLMMRIQTLPQPVIARVQGSCRRCALCGCRRQHRPILRHTVSCAHTQRGPQGCL